jgi:MFS transporter, MHS family, citrate/tricarballylate:H+ symporter
MNVIRVSSGNFLEMYDFFVFGYYASAIGKVFFPSGSDFAQLMLAFMTFGAGFLMRPLGGIFLGAYIDHYGRRAGLMLTLALMAVGTLSIALVPGYATLGALAPIIVVIGRLIQGFSAGVELGGVSVYLSEIATPGHKGFYVSSRSGSQQVAVIFVALLGVLLSTLVPPEDMLVWGWRIPFLIGCLIIPLLFILRSSLKETEEFEKRRGAADHPTPRQILFRLLQNWKIVIAGMLLVTMTTVSFYFITAYTPTFGREVLNLGSTESLIVTLCVGVSNLFWLPVMGAVSDRIGRKPVLIAFTCDCIVWRLHAGREHLSHSHYGKPRGRRSLADVCRGVRILRDNDDVSTRARDVGRGGCRCRAVIGSVNSHSVCELVGRSFAAANDH